jgi:hypothetical protein
MVLVCYSVRRAIFFEHLGLVEKKMVDSRENLTALEELLTRSDWIFLQELASRDARTRIDEKDIHGQVARVTM